MTHRPRTSATNAPSFPDWSRRNILNPRPPIAHGSALARMTRLLMFAYTTTQADIAWNMMRTHAQWRNRMLERFRIGAYEYRRAIDLMTGAIEDIAQRPKSSPAAELLDQAIIAALEETIEEIRPLAEG